MEVKGERGRGKGGRKGDIQEYREILNLKIILFWKLGLIKSRLYQAVGYEGLYTNNYYDDYEDDDSSDGYDGERQNSLT